MAFKLFILAVIVAMAHAGVIGPVGYAPAAHGFGYGPVAAHGFGYGPAVARVAAPAIAKVAVADDYDSNPQYTYAYNIHDALTGDAKSQTESRSGDVVQGQYSLVEPDGTRRVVDYTADPVNGFNAVVQREPAVAKAVVAAPAYAKVAAPLAYHG